MIYIFNLSISSGLAPMKIFSLIIIINSVIKYVINIKKNFTNKKNSRQTLILVYFFLFFLTVFISFFYWVHMFLTLDPKLVIKDLF